MFRPLLGRCVLIAVAALAPFSSLRAEGEREKAAQTAAEQWLVLLDSDKYAESWKEAAAPFQTAVAVEKWEQALSVARKPYGKLLSRKLKSAQYARNLPSAPEGEYVILQFQTALENKKEAVETVTPMLDKEGVWKVSGYFIK